MSESMQLRVEAAELYITETMNKATRWPTDKNIAAWDEARELYMIAGKALIQARQRKMSSQFEVCVSAA